MDKLDSFTKTHKERMADGLKRRNELEKQRMEHRCQICDKPMHESWVEYPTYECNNPNCQSHGIEHTECPKCGSDHLRREYVGLITQTLADDGKWTYLFHRQDSAFVYICQKCGVEWKATLVQQ